MIERVLVPLDGSTLAERALPYAMKLARSAGAELVLVRSFHAEHQVAETLPAAEIPSNDLEELAASLRLEGVAAQAVADRRPPAEAILAAARSRAVDLIVMSTHDRSGLDRWIYGSVADQVLRGALTPVLLIPSRCDRSWSAGQAGHRVLVAVDRPASAELAFPLAGRLAASLGDELQLIRSVDPLAVTWSLTSDEIDSTDDAVLTAQRSLERLARRLRERRLTVRTLARPGSPERVIADEARCAAVDVVIVCADGRDAAGHLAAGSVANAVLHQARVPLLVMPSLAAAETLASPARAAGSTGSRPIVVALSPAEVGLIRRGLRSLLQAGNVDDSDLSAVDGLLERVDASRA